MVMDDTPLINGRPMYWRLTPEREVIPATQQEFTAVYAGDFGRNRRVGKDVVGDAEVSTVFLALDHNFHPAGPPLVFETMIFGGPHSDREWRYSTWADAAAGHESIVAALREGRDPDSPE